MVNALLEIKMLEIMVIVYIWHIYDVHNELSCNWILGNKTDLQPLSNRFQDIYKWKKNLKLGVRIWPLEYNY